MSTEIVKKETSTSADVLAEVINDLKGLIPEDVVDGYKKVHEIIKSEAQLTDLYPVILTEEPLGQSIFQERCFVFEERLTPHKKLRQCMLQLQDKLGALYSAKTGEKKARIKVEKIKLKLERAKQRYQDALAKHGPDAYETKMSQLKIADMEVRLEEAQRGLSSAAHLDKDAMQKVVLYKNLADKYLEEVAKTGMSFEEAEFEFFVMYFTRDIETQLKCTGRIDPGTYQSISQLPKELRKKMFENIRFIESKLKEATSESDLYTGDGDYIYLKYWDILKPRKTGEGEIEGINVKEFLSMATVNLLASNALTSSSENNTKAISGDSEGDN